VENWAVSGVILCSASPEIKEKTPALSIEDARKAVVAQIDNIQGIIRFAQTVKSNQTE
jgi:hypothetical protein